MKKNINDIDLFYEIIISQGKGKLTEKSIELFILLVNNLSTRFYYVQDYELQKDCKQEALCKLLTPRIWQGFNTKKYDKCFSYFTEIAKRSMCKCFNEYSGKFKNDKIPEIIRFRYI